MLQHDEVIRRIASNWSEVKHAVGKAAMDSDRDPDSIRVIGVSKYVDAPMTAMLVKAGCADLGESRPQVLWQKAEELGERQTPSSRDSSSDTQRVRWHMIGHVQTNKIRRMLQFDPLVHSVDSERLLRAIDQESLKQDRITEVLLEVNISGDETKTGLSPDQLRAIVLIQGLHGVRINGLMAMAGWGTESQQAAQQFHAVASLRDQIVASTGVPLPELSMGMSGDFREAIAAGATMVRIGSALFEGVR
jgi:pyridoxal phosphate enzyme (YggS family)